MKGNTILLVLMFLLIAAVIVWKVSTKNTDQTPDPLLNIRGGLTPLNPTMGNV